MDIEELRQEVAAHIMDPAMAEISSALLLTFINSAARDARNAGWLIHLEDAETVRLAEDTYEYDVPASFAYVQQILYGDVTVASGEGGDSGADLATSINSSVTSVVVDDSSVFSVNDVIEIDSEMMLITAITGTTDTLTVTRAFFGTTAAAHTAPANVLYAGADIKYDQKIPQNYWRLKLEHGSPKVVFHSQLLDSLGVTEDIPLRFVGQKRPSLYTADSDTVDSGMESFLRERAIAYAARYLAGGGSRFSQHRAQMAQTAWLISQNMLGNHPQELRVKRDSRHVPGR